MASRFAADDENRDLAAFDAQEIAKKIAGANETARKEIAEAIAPFIYQYLNARIYNDVRDDRKIRVTKDGADVTSTFGGTAVKYAGESYFDHINVMTPLRADVESSARGRQINIRGGGGGADCMFDYLVSPCWATEVAAGRGTEGQTFTSLTGCTFKVYSTLTLMENAVETAADSAVVYICPGTYAETWTIDGTTLTAKRVTYLGSAPSRVVISALTLVDGAFADSKGLTIKNINVSGTTTFTGADSVYFEDCVFATITAGAGPSATGIIFQHCDITTTTGADLAQWSSVVFNDCTVSSTMAFSTASATVTLLLVTNCYLQGIDTGAGGSGNGIRILNNVIAGTVNGGANAIRICQADGGLVIEGNNITSTGMTGATIQLLETTGRNWGFSICGNRFNENTNGYLGTSSTSREVRRGIFAGNVFATSGGASVKATHATADFGFVTFGPNGPDCMDYSSVAPDTSAASSNVFYTSCTVPSGGTHPLYSTGSGMTGAPSPHAFVGTDHSGDDDYTLRPNVLGLGVSTGDLIIYSDAGSTEMARWDGPTGHIGIGVAPSAFYGAYVNKTIANASAAGIISAITLGAASALGEGNAIHAAIAGPSTGNQLTVIAVDASATHDGSGTLTNLIGVDSALSSNVAGSGAITTGAAFKATASVWNGDVPATTYVLFGANVGGTGATAYGIYIPAQTGTAARSFIADLLALGTDAAAVATGVNLQTGPIALPEATAPGTPSADAVVVYNETNTDQLRMIDDTGAVNLLSHKHLVSAIFDGSTASTTTPYITTPPMPHAGVITGVFSKTGENVTIGATAWIGDIHKILTANANTDGQGTTIFTTKPTITNGNMYQAYGVPDSVTTFAAGDMFCFYTDQAGTNATFITMGMQVRYT